MRLPYLLAFFRLLHYKFTRKGKPVVRRGRKAMDPAEEWDRQAAEIFYFRRSFFMKEAGEGEHIEP